MSFFEWSGSSEEAAQKTVSGNFWIYWAFTIPLTILVLVFWRIWWVWQEKSYQREVNQATGVVGEEDQKSKRHTREHHKPSR
jgi:hypothetical protein